VTKQAENMRWPTGLRFQFHSHICPYLHLHLYTYMYWYNSYTVVMHINTYNISTISASYLRVSLSCLYLSLCTYSMFFFLICRGYTPLANRPMGYQYCFSGIPFHPNSYPVALGYASQLALCNKHARTHTHTHIYIYVYALFTYLIYVI